MTADVPSSALTTTAPPIEDTEVDTILRKAFGLAGTVRRLTSERDRNFHVTGAGGSEFVLKVANAAEDPAISNLQTEALRHIEAKAPDLPISRVCPSLDGRFETVVRIAAGTEHVVRLLTFLPGTPLYRTPHSQRQTVNLGSCLASIGLALQNFRHPAAAHDLLWDLQRAARLQAYLGHVRDARLRHLAERGLDHFNAAILPRMPFLRSQVVHNDLNPHNVLVDPCEPSRITGVLDFGDMVQTALINDVAVAAAYQVEGADAVGRMAAFVGAYHAHAALLPAELEVLFDLIVLRQIMTIVITEWRASLYPENRDYILRNQPRAAAALETLTCLGQVAGTSLLRQACEME